MQNRLNINNPFLEQKFNPDQRDIFYPGEASIKQTFTDPPVMLIAYLNMSIRIVIASSLTFDYQVSAFYEWLANHTIQKYFFLLSNQEFMDVIKEWGNGLVKSDWQGNEVRSLILDFDGGVYPDVSKRDLEWSQKVKLLFLRLLGEKLQLAYQGGRADLANTLRNRIILIRSNAGSQPSMTTEFARSTGNEPPLRDFRELLFNWTTSDTQEEHPPLNTVRKAMDGNTALVSVDLADIFIDQNELTDEMNQVYILWQKTADGLIHTELMHRFIGLLFKLSQTETTDTTTEALTVSMVDLLGRFKNLFNTYLATGFAAEIKQEESNSRQHSGYDSQTSSSTVPEDSGSLTMESFSKNNTSKALVEACQTFSSSSLSGNGEQPPSDSRHTKGDNCPLCVGICREKARQLKVCSVRPKVRHKSNVPRKEQSADISEATKGRFQETCDTLIELASIADKRQFNVQKLGEVRQLLNAFGIELKDSLDEAGSAKELKVCMLIQQALNEKVDKRCIDHLKKQTKRKQTTDLRAKLAQIIKSELLKMLSDIYESRKNHEVYEKKCSQILDVMGKINVNTEFEERVLSLFRSKIELDEERFSASFKVRKRCSSFNLISFGFDRNRVDNFEQYQSTLCDLEAEVFFRNVLLRFGFLMKGHNEIGISCRTLSHLDIDLALLYIFCFQHELNDSILRSLKVQPPALEDTEINYRAFCTVFNFSIYGLILGSGKRIISTIGTFSDLFRFSCEKDDAEIYKLTISSNLDFTDVEAEGKTLQEIVMQPDWVSFLIIRMIKSGREEVADILFCISIKINLSRRNYDQARREADLISPKSPHLKALVKQSIAIETGSLIEYKTVFEDENLNRIMEGIYSVMTSLYKGDHDITEQHYCTVSRTLFDMGYISESLRFEKNASVFSGLYKLCGKKRKRKIKSMKVKPERKIKSMKVKPEGKLKVKGTSNMDVDNFLLTSSRHIVDNSCSFESAAFKSKNKEESKPDNISLFFKLNRMATEYCFSPNTHIDYEQLDQEMNDAVEKYPDDLWLLQLRGWFLFEHEHVDEAKKLFMKGLSIALRLPYTLSGHSGSNQQTNKQARKILDQVAEFETENASDCDEIIIATKRDIATFLSSYAHILKHHKKNELASEFRNAADRLDDRRRFRAHKKSLNKSAEKIRVLSQDEFDQLVK